MAAGEPALLAERFGVRVVSGFRTRDVAAGGQGAPLVPMADVLLFGAGDAPRVLLNLGGMANLTFVERRGRLEGAFAFDTGPGMSVIDDMARLADPSLPYDKDAYLSSRGTVDEVVLKSLLADPFFAAASTQEHRPGTFRTELRQDALRPAGRSLGSGDGGRADGTKRS